MWLFLAGRLPVTSKGAALNHPSQPRGRALMHDVPSAVRGSRVCKVRRQHAPWRLGKGLRATTKLRRRSPSLTRSSTVIGIFPGFVEDPDAMTR